MKDNNNRIIKHIRFSITSHCNSNCIYCDKEGFTPKMSELTVEEITKLCKILAKVLNVSKIKLTGGEPLCRKEIISIVKNISNLGFYKDISMTTNGLLLGKKAKELFDAGLNRINVSLATLNPQRYKRICNNDSLETVLKALEISKDIGFNPIKINYVILKNINDDEFWSMSDFCNKKGYILQLIELHQVAKSVGGGNNLFYQNYHYNTIPLIKQLEKKSNKTIIRSNMQNRKKFILSNGAIIETIVPSHEFCMGCTKLRIGCDGNLFGCLFRSDLGKNLKESLKAHYSLEKYDQIIRQIVDSREPYY
ncbi:MAG: GTP 3',8-cyclase MoaA [Candidatus Lokiarchaeota archaeon]|nr:GTP 3',8-cyclase MoaA [Candidatus Lokiarchaeota archaeon]